MLACVFHLFEVFRSYFLDDRPVTDKRVDYPGTSFLKVIGVVRTRKKDFILCLCRAQSGFTHVEAIRNFRELAFSWHSSCQSAFRSAADAKAHFRASDFV